MKLTNECIVPVSKETCYALCNLDRKIISLPEIKQKIINNVGNRIAKEYLGGIVSCE